MSKKHCVQMKNIAIPFFFKRVYIATRVTQTIAQPQHHQPLIVALAGAFCLEGAMCPGLYGHSSATLPRDTH